MPLEKRVLSFLFFYPIYYPRTTLAHPPSSNSDPGSHSGPSSPLPTTVRAFVFMAKNNRAFSFLVDSRRIVPTHAARPSQQFILFLAFLQIYSKSHHGGNRTHGPRLVAFEGNRWTTGAIGTLCGLLVVVSKYETEIHVANTAKVIWPIGHAISRNKHAGGGGIERRALWSFSTKTADTLHIANARRCDGLGMPNANEC